MLASAIAFTPSFAFTLLGAKHFDRLHGNDRVRAFLDGSAPAAIGAIFGSAVPLALTLTQLWHSAVLEGALIPLLVLRRGVVTTLALAGATIPH